MIVLYSLMMLVLCALLYLVQRRAAALENRFSRLSLHVKKLSSRPLPQQGNRNGADPCRAAKLQFELGRLVTKRDRVESKCLRWQFRLDKLTRLVNTLRQWKVRKLPYTFGAIDVSLLFYVIDRFGLGPIALSQIRQFLVSMIS